MNADISSDGIANVRSSWPLVVRAVLVVSLAAWNLLMFLPRAVQTVRP